MSSPSEARSPETASGPSAAERMSAWGAEEEWLAQSAGTWNVVATMWPTPDAEPIVSEDLVAERTMIGSLLQEVLRPAPGSGRPDFHRIDYLHYDRVEGRWKYVSMDTRLPVSIMPAWSFRGAENGSIVLEFEPLGLVGFGAEVEGRLTRSNMVINRPAPDRETKQQHFIQANGTGVEWLAVEYSYRRAG